MSNIIENYQGSVKVAPTLAANLASWSETEVLKQLLVTAGIRSLGTEFEDNTISHLNELLLLSICPRADIYRDQLSVPSGKVNNLRIIGK